MATITITIPDALVTLYNTARAEWNPIIASEGGNLIPAPTKVALETLLKKYIKGRILSNALRAGVIDDEFDALQAQLDKL